MDSRQRVKAALDHREGDRVPLDIGGTRVTGIHREAYARFREGLGLPPRSVDALIRYLELAKVDEDFRRLLEVDLESVDPATRPFERELPSGPGEKAYVDLWGCEWVLPSGSSYYGIRRHPLAGAESVADVERFPWPRGDDPVLLAPLTDAARAAWHERHRAVALGRTGPGVFEMCQVLRGHEQGLADFAANPAVSEAIMDRVLAHKIAYYRAAIERLRDAGLEWFIVSESDDLGSQAGLLVGHGMYRSLVKPRHRRLFDEILRASGGRAYLELHCCGAIRELIPDLLDVGVQVLNPVQVSAAGMDTGELKRDFGGDLVFHGGGVDSQRTLPYGTPDEVRTEVTHRMLELAPGGGFIFTPVHSIQHDVPFANFASMLDGYRATARVGDQTASP